MFMPAKIELLMPFGEASKAPQGPRPKLATRLETLAGATIGVVWNGWHCMEVMTHELGQILVREFGTKEVVALQTGTTLPMSDAQLANARDKWDAAIVGLGT
jgi:hypothetical protein